MKNNPPLDNQQKAILALLAREWENAGPPGIVDIIDIARYLGVSADEIRQALTPLFEGGVVDVDRIGTAAYLTPDGYAQACKQFAA